MAERKTLGKGLGALLERSNMKSADTVEEVRLIDVQDIMPLEGQPRQSFDDEKLAELAASIQEHGVLQPIIIRLVGEHRYQLIAGERRWRASILAGLKTIPAIVRDVAENERLAQALIENIQRESLKALEEAEAFEKLMQEHGLTQEQLAHSVGKSRSSIANALRLLKLPLEVRHYLDEGNLSTGHAKVLLSLADEQAMILFADHCLEKNWSVRQLEEEIAKTQNQKAAAAEGKAKLNRQTAFAEQYQLNLKELETKLSRHYGAKIKIKDRAGKGKIEIPYKSQEELERLLEALNQV